MNDNEKVVNLKHAEYLKTICYWEEVSYRLLASVVRGGVVKQDYLGITRLFSIKFPDILHELDDSADIDAWCVGFEREAIRLLEREDGDAISQFFDELIAAVYKKFARVSYAISVAMNNGGYVPESKLGELYEVEL